MIPNLGVGGAERMVLNLAANLDRARYDVLVLSFYDAFGNTVEPELAASGIPVVHLGKRRGFDPRMFGRIPLAIARFEPDVVHTHRAVLQYAMPALAGRLRRRVAHTVHSVAEMELPRLGRLAHWAAFRAGVAPIAIGKFVAKSISRVYGIDPRAVIPHGIPVSRYATPNVGRSEWRAAHGISEAALVFACVARLTPPKNIASLLAAFASLAESGAMLLVAGDGPLRSDLESEAERLAVAARVRFLGTRSDIPDLLAASDVFVLSSLWEGNPLSVMEAMAAGKPTIATAVGGVPEFVSDGETGLLVAPDDAAALARAMRLLARDLEMRERLGRNARRIAAEAYDVRPMVDAYDRLYQEMLAGRPPRHEANLAG